MEPLSVSLSVFYYYLQLSVRVTQQPELFYINEPYTITVLVFFETKEFFSPWMCRYHLQPKFRLPLRGQRKVFVEYHKHFGHDDYTIHTIKYWKIFSKKCFLQWEKLEDSLTASDHYKHQAIRINNFAGYKISVCQITSYPAKYKIYKKLNSLRNTYIYL